MKGPRTHLAYTIVNSKPVAIVSGTRGHLSQVTPEHRELHH